MSDASQSLAGILLITIPAVVYGGVSLLWFISRRVPGYLDNPVRQNLFRAGHAHAGVFILLALIAMLYIDQTNLSEGMKTLTRTLLVVPPILMPLGFFLSVTSPQAERPNKLIWLVYVGAVSLVAGVLILGIGLL